MSADRFQIDWVPPGPVAAAFMEDWSPISFLMGPIGSGKTTACLMKIVRAAQLQRPSPRDGVRRHKHLVFRDTFTNIERTIFPSWWNIFPKEMGEWVGGPPARHRLRFRDRHGPIELHVDFMGLGDESLENLLRGYEATGFYANEVDLLSYAGVSFALSRMGRYPGALDGGPRWYGGWCDFNAPEQDHWLYRLLVDGIVPDSDPPKPAAGVRFFRQPGGLDPAAENRANLPAGYYEQRLGTMRDWEARRLIHNQWGYSRDGKPVYAEFSDAVHIASSVLEPVRGVPLAIGSDAGGSPACVVGQFLPASRLRVFGEVVFGPGTGPRRFAEAILELLRARAPWARPEEIEGWLDPSAWYGGDAQGADPAWAQTLMRATRIRFRPAPTNAPAMRQEALRTYFSGLVEGRPKIEICPSCRHLRRALNSGYHFRRIQVGGASGRFDTRPAKNEWSHVAEALEYLALGGPSGLRAVMTGQPAMAHRSIKVEADYDMLG